ncbi:DNA repair protein RecN [Catenovulum sp. SM1970]|uniref:DNA repair protein RecN n=1 Tax=Marinifaba aquimaris TaxID=2741323 RepID=UPI001571B5B0|nr:DNA repair protein RecN [Marinifaba aquimaris]NTS77565.1 DNA repair protein RecN [Marinifaba aquimaris]
MLSHLFVKDFAIVESLDLEFQAGMTTITGETGAGKSISIDALGLCLGDRADAGMVRAGASKAEISATFNISDIVNAQNWLIQHDLADSNSNECIIRRVISCEGRSRAFINGSPVALQQLKALGVFLINIHGQHAHQALTKSDYQLTLVDSFAGHDDLLESVHNAYQYWDMRRSEYKKLKQQESQQADRLQLIEYQVAELDEFNLQQGEFEQIEEEQKILANTSQLMTESQTSLTMLYDGDEHSAFGLVQGISNKLAKLAEVDEKLAPVIDMLNEAQITLEEASHDLRGYLDKLEPDPERLNQAEQRLSTALELARKHKVKPESLPDEHQQLAAELAEIKSLDAKSEELEKELQQAEKHYYQLAEKLTQSRQRHAANLADMITASMQQLNMAQGQFAIELRSLSTPTKLGADMVEFLVSANPGQPLQAIHKVASGGELSRISLAIQVITAEKIAMPSLIFDEVDVGISGQTASVVGQMLRRIGEQTQIICVTHLPQVAACGHQQMQVAKQTDGKQTQTEMIPLNSDNRVIELARLLGGDQVTDIAIANAKELLAG